MSGHDDLRRLAVMHRVRQRYLRARDDFFIDGGDLIAQLADIYDADDLDARVRTVYPQRGPNGKGARFSGSIFGLGDERVVGLLGYHRD